MSDSLPPEFIEQLKRRDSRFAILARSIAVEQDLRDNTTIGAIMVAVEADAKQAMEDICGISPLDTAAIAAQQVKIMTYSYIRGVMNKVLRLGAEAEAHIRAEDEIHRDDDV